MSRSFTREDVNIALAYRGIELIGEYLGNNALARFRGTCGHEWQASPGNVKKGTGCPECAGTKRQTAEQVNAIIAHRGIELIGPYVNSSTPAQFRGNCGHEWQARPGNIKSGKGCPHCSGNARLTVEGINTRLAPRGIRLIGPLIDSQTPALFRGACGHDWENPPTKVIQGGGCPHCAGRRQTRVTINAELAPRGIVMLDEFAGVSNKNRFRCELGHEWITTPTSVKACNGCPHCYGNARKTTEQVNNEFVFRGIKLLSEYTGSNDKGRFRGSCGHEWMATPSHVISGTGCPHCAGYCQTRESINEELAPRGILMLEDYTTAKARALFRGDCGHEWRSPVTSVKSGTGCPHCAGFYQTRETINVELAPRGLVMLDEFAGMGNKSRFRCEQGHEWEQTPQVVKGGNGCPHCAGFYRTRELINSELAPRGIVMLDEFLGADSRARFRADCGHEWQARVADVRGGSKKGTGCPHCSNESVISKSGVLVYVMDYSLGLTKIGITYDTISRRTRLFNAAREAAVSREVSLVAAYLLGSGTGIEAHAAEQAAHLHFEPQHAGLTGFKGSNEIFHITPMQACEYLCRAGGVPTTPEQRAALLAEGRFRSRALKGEETPEQRAQRLSRRREYTRRAAARETPEQRAARIERNRANNARYLARKKAAAGGNS